jgi:hypothetical protein
VESLFTASLHAQVILSRIGTKILTELVGSLQTYELSLPPVKKLKTIALKASKKKVEASSEDDFEDEEKKDPRGPRCFECSGFAGILRRARGRVIM